MQPHWQQPSHPEVLEVITQPGSFSTYSRANSFFPAGKLLARLTAPTLSLSKRAYSSVQVGVNENIELNCDFLYINHSCEPNLEFHVLESHKLSPSATETDHPIVIEVRVAPRLDAQGKVFGLAQGEELSFFYPSTEWDMSQPFQCKCQTKSCKGLIRGAKYLDSDQLKGYFINEHILELKKVQDKSNGTSNASLASDDGASASS